MLPSTGIVKDDDIGASLFDVDDQLEKATGILMKEIRNLQTLSVRGKLSPTDARDLVSYIKLLAEMQKLQADAAANLTDEQLTSKISKP